jgi:hypothetical protein
VEVFSCETGNPPGASSVVSQLGLDGEGVGIPLVTVYGRALLLAARRRRVHTSRWSVRAYSQHSQDIVLFGSRVTREGGEVVSQHAFTNDTSCIQGVRLCCAVLCLPWYLCRAHVLKLVDEDVSELIAIGLEHLRVLSEEPQCVQQQVAEVDDFQCSQA